MLTKTGEKVKTIVGETAFDFDSKLNSFTDKLDAKGIRYKLDLSVSAGLIAFVIYEKQITLPECVKDEYELAGEKHNCIECPFYVRPTDGRVKNTRCPKTEKLRRANDPCCEDFYKWLDRGEIKLIEVGR